MSLFTLRKKIRSIFYDYTDLVEPVSLDEAYLDVTDCPLLQGSATRIAQNIRLQVQQQLQITVSAGVASNKLLAKIASDWNKPDGQYQIKHDQSTRRVKNWAERKLTKKPET